MKAQKVHNPNKSFKIILVYLSLSW